MVLADRSAIKAVEYIYIYQRQRQIHVLLWATGHD